MGRLQPCAAPRHAVCERTRAERCGADLAAADAHRPVRPRPEALQVLVVAHAGSAPPPRAGALLSARVAVCPALCCGLCPPMYRARIFASCLCTNGPMAGTSAAWLLVFNSGSHPLLSRCRGTQAGGTRWSRARCSGLCARARPGLEQPPFATAGLVAAIQGAAQHAGFALRRSRWLVRHRTACCGPNRARGSQNHIARRARGVQELRRRPGAGAGNRQ